MECQNFFYFKTQPEQVPKMQPQRFSAGNLTRDPRNVAQRSNRHAIRSEKSMTFHSLFNGNLQSVLRMTRHLCFEGSQENFTYELHEVTCTV